MKPSIYILLFATSCTFSPQGNLLDIARRKGSVSVQNFRDNTTLQSGFLTGTATDDIDVDSVEVSLDSGIFIAAILSGTGKSVTWRFALPTGGNTWREGSRHTIKVRMRNRSGAYAESANISVRKGRNKDINGDGYPDLVSSAHFYNTDQGRVYIFYGSITGVSQTTATSANTVITGVAGSQFGIHVAVGDINADGYADLVVGAYQDSPGKAYVFQSAGASGITASAATSATQIITGEGTTNFGANLALGDVNGDGYDDLAVGAWDYAGANQGRAYIFVSTGGAGINQTLASSANRIIDGPATVDNFGWSIALGDITGDGFADLGVGASDFNNGDQGWVYLFHSSGTAGISITSAGAASRKIDGPASSRFGYSVAFGDINGDGYADLVSCANIFSPGGRAYVFHSSGLAGITSTSATTATRIIDGENGGGFCRGIVISDLNGDGYDDLILGDNLYSTSKGRNYLFYSSGTAGINTSLATSATLVIDGQTGSGFGNFAAATDLNGDGYLDLILAGNVYSTQQGRVYIFNGSANITTTAAANASLIIDGEAGSQFGRAVP